MTNIIKPPAEVLAAWPLYCRAAVRRIDAGLINDTFHLTNPAGQQAVLQRLHPVFGPGVNEDIAAVTAHLARHDVCTPHLIATADDAWETEHDARTWRLLSYLPGATVHRFTSPVAARSAARLVARFHSALEGFDYVYRKTRSHIHDTAKHLAALQQALGSTAGHRFGDVVRPLAEELLAHSTGLEFVPQSPVRHAHGDLKVSNLLFDSDGSARCLIDLDTLAPMPWALEMGDALRSWCNPGEEDCLPARLDLKMLDAVMAGYGSARPGYLGDTEIDALVPGLQQICLELCARFLTDTLTENYFGWDATRYASRGEHNLARARAMWSLFLDVRAHRDEALAIVHRHLPG